MQQLTRNDTNENAWTFFSHSLSAPFNHTPFLLQFDGGDNDTSFFGSNWWLFTTNATGNGTDPTLIQEITKHLQHIIMDDDGSFLYIPFVGAIYIGIVFLVLLITYCRHFSHVNDRRIRWIRHSTNSTCLTGPGTMTVICNNWVYLCRQHGHFGIAHKGQLGQHIKKMKITQTRRTRQMDVSVEDITIEQSQVSQGSDQEQLGMSNNDIVEVPPALPMTDVTVRRTGSTCCPWTSYPTPTGLVSYRELGEPTRHRPETPAGQYYCVSGRHTPADEQIEFWDYTPELERRAALEVLHNAAAAAAASATSSVGGPGGSAGTNATRTTNVTFTPNLTSNPPPSSPSSPSSSLMLPRPSLPTPNLSALTRATTSITPQQYHHHQRRKSSNKRQSSLKRAISHDERTPEQRKADQQAHDEEVARWNELTAAMMAKQTTFASKPSSDKLDSMTTGPTDFQPRERTSSTGSNRDKSDSMQMQQMRSYSPSTQRRQGAQQSQQASGGRPPQSRAVVEDDGGTATRRGGAGGILAITKIGREIRDKQFRYN